MQRPPNIDKDKITCYLAECEPLLKALNEVIGKYVTNPDRSIKPVILDGKLTIVFDSYEAFPVYSK